MSKLGILSKVYRNTGTYGAPVWVEVTSISDLSVEANWDEGEASTRASRVKKTKKTMLDVPITGKIKVSDTDAAYIAFWNAAHSDDVLDLMILNGSSSTNGVRGYRGEFDVNTPKEDQGMGNVLFMEFSLKPSDSAEQFSKVVVSGGAPTFTAL